MRQLENREDISGLFLKWLEPAGQGALAAYQGWIEELRVSLNRLLYLGLFEFESHFAVYPPGAGYQKHLDNFRGTSARIVSAVLYLNDDWDEADGGQLRLYTDDAEDGGYVDVLDRFTWEDWQGLRQDAMQHGFDSRIAQQPVIPLLEAMLDIAKAGLQQRGLQEEHLLMPLYERLVARQSPADRVMQCINDKGLPAIVEDFSFNTLWRNAVC